MEKVKLQGFVDISTVDYPSKVSCVVFFQGCNLRCPYCQNPDGIPINGGVEVTLSEVKKRLKEAFTLADAVHFSGGEPTLQWKAIIQLIEYAHMEGKLAGISTNGTIPSAISKLADKLDFIAVDVKAPPTIPRILGRTVGLLDKGEEIAEKLFKTLETLQSYSSKTEARTTIVPGLNDKPEYIIAIAESLGEIKRIRLNQFRNTVTLDPKLREVQPPTRERLLKLARAIASKHPDLEVKIWTAEAGEEEVIP